MSGSVLHFFGAMASHLMLLPLFEQQHGNENDCETDPDCPPIFFGKQFAESSRLIRAVPPRWEHLLRQTYIPRRFLAFADALGYVFEPKSRARF